MVMEEVVKEAHTMDVPPPRQAGPVDQLADLLLRRVVRKSNTSPVQELSGNSLKHDTVLCA